MSDSVPNPAVVALVKASAEMPNPMMDSKNGAFRRPDGQPHKYASLNAFLDAIKPVLAKYDLALFQPVSTNPNTGMIEVQTMFMHVSGSNVTFPPLGMPLNPGMTCQQAGTSISYMRRYSLQSALGLAADDNDAEDDRRAAAGATAPKAQAASQTAQRASEDRPRTVPASPTTVGTSRAPNAPETTLGVAKSLPDPTSDSRTVVGRVTYVKATEGTNRNGNAYTKYRVGLKATDTDTFGSEPLYGTTFDRSFGAILTDAKTTGAEVSVVLKNGQYGDEIVAVRSPVPANVEAEDDIPF